MIYEIHTPQEMVALGGRIAGEKKKILLYGDLGAGKTHFVQGFAAALCEESHTVTSPTFAYMNVYGGSVLHIDMYRVESADVLYARGIVDQIDSFDAVCVERPRREEEYVDEEWTRITISRGEKEMRVVELEE